MYGVSTANNDLSKVSPSIVPALALINKSPPILKSPFWSVLVKNTCPCPSASSMTSFACIGKPPFSGNAVDKLFPDPTYSNVILLA